VALYQMKAYTLTVKAAASSETALHMYRAEQLRISAGSHPYYCGGSSPESDDVTVL
jgi:hypothetical protein